MNAFLDLIWISILFSPSKYFYYITTETVERFPIKRTECYIQGVPDNFIKVKRYTEIVLMRFEIKMTKLLINICFYQGKTNELKMDFCGQHFPNHFEASWFLDSNKTKRTQLSGTPCSRYAVRETIENLKLLKNDTFDLISPAIIQKYLK